MNAWRRVVAYRTLAVMQRQVQEPGETIVPLVDDQVRSLDLQHEEMTQRTHKMQSELSELREKYDAQCVQLESSQHSCIDLTGKVDFLEEELAASRSECETLRTKTSRLDEVEERCLQQEQEISQLKENNLESSLKLLKRHESLSTLHSPGRLDRMSSLSTIATGESENKQSPSNRLRPPVRASTSKIRNATPAMALSRSKSPGARRQLMQTPPTIARGRATPGGGGDGSETPSSCGPKSLSSMFEQVTRSSHKGSGRTKKVK